MVIVIKIKREDYTLDVSIDNTIECYALYYDRERYSTYGGKIKINLEACKSDDVLEQKIIHELTHEALEGVKMLSQENICKFNEIYLGRILNDTLDILEWLEEIK